MRPPNQTFLMNGKEKSSQNFEKMCAFFVCWNRSIRTFLRIFEKHTVKNAHLYELFFWKGKFFQFPKIFDTFPKKVSSTHLTPFSPSTLFTMISIFFFMTTQFNSQISKLLSITSIFWSKMKRKLIEKVNSN